MTRMLEGLEKPSLLWRSVMLPPLLTANLIGDGPRHQHRHRKQQQHNSNNNNINNNNNNKKKEEQTKTATPSNYMFVLCFYHG